MRGRNLTVLGPRDAVRSARDTLDRVGSATGLAQDKYGLTIGQVYCTVGAHDLVGFMEAPEAESLSAFLVRAWLGGQRSHHHDAYVRPG